MIIQIYEIMNLKEVRKLLPSGGMRTIAERTKIGYSEITRMFRGLETKNTPIVVKATTEYLAELEAQRKELQKF